MVDISKAVIARIKKGGKNFEILVDCERALDYKSGKVKDLSGVLATEEVFEDIKKGTHASQHDMVKIFGIDDPFKVSAIIIKEGEIQLTADHLKKEREQKKKQIITLIHRNAIDPKTNFPHPIQRIESAIEEAGVRIDEHKTAEEQIQGIIKELSEILPIKYETKEIMIKIPAQYAGKAFTSLKQYSKILKEEWQNDGSLMTVVAIPAGLMQEFFDKLNNLTRGEIESKIIK